MRLFNRLTLSIIWAESTGLPLADFDLNNHEDRRGVVGQVIVEDGGAAVEQGVGKSLPKDFEWR